MIYLILAFTVIPAVELFLLLQLGAMIGPFQTFMIVVLTGTAGAWLAKREGFGVMSELRAEIAQGVPPGSRLAEGLLVLVGGILLVTPGVLTDLTGFAFIFPVTRRWLAPRLVAALLARFDLKVDLGAPTPHEGTPKRRPIGPGGPHHEGPTPFSSPFDDLP